MVPPRILPLFVSACLEAAEREIFYAVYMLIVPR
jgi:hypothetical protein